MRCLIVPCLLVVATEIVVANPLDSEYRAASLFVSLLDGDLPQESSCTNVWVTPKSFVHEEGITNYVTLAGSRRTDRGELYFMDCHSNEGLGDATVCICSNRIAALEELCLPIVAFSSMPIDMKASSYSVTVSSNGLLRIVGTIQNENIAMYAFGNASIRFEGANAPKRALALFRAGGVEIPADQESPAPEPTPEP